MCRARLAQRQHLAPLPLPPAHRPPPSADPEHITATVCHTNIVESKHVRKRCDHKPSSLVKPASRGPGRPRGLPLCTLACTRSGCPSRRKQPARSRAGSQRQRPRCNPHVRAPRRRARPLAAGRSSCLGWSPSRGEGSSSPTPALQRAAVRAASRPWRGARRRHARPPQAQNAASSHPCSLAAPAPSCAPRAPQPAASRTLGRPHPRARPRGARVCYALAPLYSLGPPRQHSDPSSRRRCRRRRL